MSAPDCSAGHGPMKLANRFRFDHEAGDDPSVTMKLVEFKAMGVELGAEVSVYECATCGNVLAEFGHGDLKPR